MIEVVLAILIVWVGYLFGSYHTLATQDTKSESSNVAAKSSSHKQKKVKASSSSKAGKDTTNSSSQENGSDASTTQTRRYSNDEETTAQKYFLEWAKVQAQKGNMAVTDRFFDHGASGKGDWFAETEDGKALIQQQFPDNPGYNAYKMHVLGGVTFYTAKDGTTGYDEAVNENDTASGIANLADKSKQIHKYLLCDNGVVYEAIGSYNDLVAFSSPYGLYDDDGQTETIHGRIVFKISQDQAAQNEWKRILAGL